MVLRAELITFKIFQFILLAKLFNVFNTLEIWCDNAIAITTTQRFVYTCVCVAEHRHLYRASGRANERTNAHSCGSRIFAVRVYIEVNEKESKSTVDEYEMDKYNI